MPTPRDCGGDVNFSSGRNDFSVNAYFAGIGCNQSGDKKQRRRFATA